MKTHYVATLAFSSVVVGVLLTLFVQYKLGARGKANKREASAVLNPAFFAGGKSTLPPVVSTPEEDQTPVQQTAVQQPPPVARDAGPPVGSGERWTPLK